MTGLNPLHPNIKMHLLHTVLLSLLGFKGLIKLVKKHAIVPLNGNREVMMDTQAILSHVLYGVLLNRLQEKTRGMALKTKEKTTFPLLTNKSARKVSLGSVHGCRHRIRLMPSEVSHQPF